MATTVYLIRHGRTALNAAGMLRGWIDAPLDDTGRSEAARLGSLFAAVRLDRIVSSPLGRSFDTARAIAEPHGLPIDVDPGFADRDYGPWAGRSQEEVEARYGSVDGAPASEIEPVAGFWRRVEEALQRVVARAGDRTVAVVGHDAVNRALIRAFSSKWRETEAALPQPTGCWNRLVFKARGALCEVVGAIPGDGTRP